MALPLIAIGAFWLGTSILGAYAGKKFLEKSEKDYFNNGICKKCGGHFKEIEGTEITGNKGYKCDICDNCVWISFGTDLDYEYKSRKKE